MFSDKSSSILYLQWWWMIVYWKKQWNISGKSCQFGAYWSWSQSLVLYKMRILCHRIVVRSQWTLIQIGAFYSATYCCNSVINSAMCFILPMAGLLSPLCSLVFAHGWLQLAFRCKLSSDSVPAPQIWLLMGIFPSYPASTSNQA